MLDCDSSYFGLRSKHFRGVGEQTRQRNRIFTVLATQKMGREPKKVGEGEGEAKEGNKIVSAWRITSLEYSRVSGVLS